MSASALASSGSFLVSPASKRLFSRRRTAPAGSPEAISETSSPTTAGACFTSAPSSSPRRLPTGPIEKSGSGPLGRPRWETRTMLAPPSRSSSIVGSEARIRVSSATPPPSRGTLRSARRRTLRPSTSASLTLALRNEREPVPSGTYGGRLQHLLRQFDAALRVAPLVVVPREDLHELPVDDRGLLGVEDRRVRVGDDVGGDDRVLGVPKDPVQWPGSRLLHRRVDLLGARLARCVADQVDRRRPRPALVLVRHVLEALVGRIGVNRRHQTPLDPHRVVQDLGHGCEAVGRARRVGDDVVLLGVVVALE